MGGDHHGGHHDTFKIPKDHTIFKVEDVPRLVQLRDQLAKEGLKDPWMRNEVSRYLVDHVPLRARIYRICGGRFMPIGMGIGVAAAALQYAWDAAHPEPDHHDDHH